MLGRLNAAERRRRTHFRKGVEALGDAAHRLEEATCHFEAAGRMPNRIDHARLINDYAGRIRGLAKYWAMGA